MSKIQIIRGDTYNLNLTFKTPLLDSNGVQTDATPIDITGSTVFLTVKCSLKDGDPEAKISKTTTSHTDPVNGKTLITLTADDTNLPEGSYFYDIQLLGAGGEINSTIRDEFSVVEDVTKRVE